MNTQSWPSDGSVEVASALPPAGPNLDTVGGRIDALNTLITDWEEAGADRAAVWDMLIAAERIFARGLPKLPHAQFMYELKTVTGVKLDVVENNCIEDLEFPPPVDIEDPPPPPPAPLSVQPTGAALSSTKVLITEWREAGSKQEAITTLIERVRDLAAKGILPSERALIETELKHATGLGVKAFALPPASVRIAGAQALAQVMVAPTESGVAQLFETEYGNDFRFCKAWGWSKNLGTHWAREQTDLAFHYCGELAQQANFEKKSSIAKASFARGVETFARASRKFATTPDQWDRDHWLLNTPGGVVDLQSGKIREHNPDDYLTRITQVAPVAGPKPMFERFLNQICCNDNELVLYHWRAFGACLSGAIQDHWMIFGIGEGSNGKNTESDLYQWALGSYAKQIPTETLMSAKGERHPTEMANMLGIRVAFSSEVAEGSHWNESRIKSLTGDAMITGRFMRGDFFEFPRTHKHIIAGNHRPQLRVVDEAMRRRLHIVPYKAKFSDALGNKDPLLPQKLKAEGPAILAWLIEGHRQWLADGYLKRCEAVRRETDDYFEAQSTPEMWVSERCREDPDARAKAGDLYRDFSWWKEDRGEQPMSQTRWGDWMTTRYLKSKSDGSITYKGIRLVREG